MANGNNLYIYTYIYIHIYVCVCMPHVEQFRNFFKYRGVVLWNTATSYLDFVYETMVISTAFLCDNV